MNFLRDLRVYDKDNIPVSVKIMSQLKNIQLALTPNLLVCLWVAGPCDAKNPKWVHD